MFKLLPVLFLLSCTNVNQEYNRLGIHAYELTVDNTFVSDYYYESIELSEIQQLYFALVTSYLTECWLLWKSLLLTMPKPKPKTSKMSMIDVYIEIEDIFVHR